jgi:hypothetical protein
MPISSDLAAKSGMEQLKLVQKQPKWLSNSAVVPSLLPDAILMAEQNEL